MRYTLLLFLLLMPVAVHGFSVEVEIGPDPDMAVLGDGPTVEANSSPARLLEVVVLPPGWRVAGYRVISEEWVRADGSAAEPADPAETGDLVYVGSGMFFGYNLLMVAAEPVRLTADGSETLRGMRLGIECEEGAAGLTAARRGELTDAFLEAALREAFGVDVSGQGTWAVTAATDWITDGPSLDGSAVDCVIVTNDDLAAEFERLAAWHDLMGIRTVVRTVGWIESRYPGADSPERIRNFLKDAYSKWGTVYALLGGDPAVVPMRVLEYDWLWSYTAETADEISVDCYYSNLDGDWNGDGDQNFGEGGSYSDDDGIDAYADIVVGRAPVESVDEAKTFVDKTILYTRGGRQGDWYDRTVFMAQIVFREPEFDGAQFAESILEHFPDNYEQIKLYEKYEAYDDAIPETLENCVSYMSQGAGIVSHIGHGDFFRLNLGQEMMWRWQVDSLSNDSTFFFMYMMNCASANPGVESIAKNFVRNPTGGAVAVIGNQIFAAPRNGLDLEESVFELMFGSDNLTLGVVTTIPRHTYALPSRNYPWWTYLNNILYGDPCIRIWESTPGSLEVSGAASIGLGDSLYTVTVGDGGLAVEGATVVLSGERGEYGAALTDASGEAVVRYRPRGPGAVDLVVGADGYLPSETSLSVAGSGGRLYVSSMAVNDSEAGTYTGNGDSEAGWGERFGLGAGVTNGGSGTLAGVTGTLSPVAGCSIRVDVEFTGPETDPPVYLGSSCESPQAVPFKIGGSDRAFGRCTRDLGEQDGCWIWLDSRGWHFRMAGVGEEGYAYRCSIEVFGDVSGYLGVQLEDGDMLAAGDGYFVLAGELAGKDYEDGFDFQSGRDCGVTIHDAVESYGEVGSNEVIRYFDVELTGDACDGLPVWFELGLEDGGGERWYDWFPVVAAAGLPRVEVFSGFGGFPYDFNIGLRNTGGGGLKGLTGTVRAIEGITLSDSTSSYGDLASGEYSDGDDYSFTGAAGNATVEIEIKDAFGRVWLDTVYERTVDAPENVTYSVGDGYAELRWDPSADERVHHYEIYRGAETFESELVGVAEGHSRFVDSEVSAEEDYFYEVRARDDMGNGSEFTAELEVWTAAPYLDGFPVEIRGAAWSSPVAGDADHDGLKEIFVGSRGQDLAAFDVNGVPLYGYPYTCTCEVRSSPALADLDGDGTLECVFGIGMDVVGGPSCTEIVALNHDGSPVNPANNPGIGSGAPGWPRTVGSVVRSAPAVYDLDDDGHIEIIIGTMGKVDGYGPVYAYRYDGSPYLEGEPVFGQCTNVIWTSPCIADLDDDDKPEVIVVDLSGSIYIWKWDGGAYLADSTGLLADTDAAFWASPAAGDVDGDGALEIVAVNDWGHVYVWNHDGSPVGGDGGRVASLGGTCWSDPALADFDGDGALEIVFGLGPDPGRLIILEGDGSPYGNDEVVFTSKRSLGWVSPAIADIDEDGELEIIACSVDAWVYGLNPDGTHARGFPRRIDGFIYSSPLIDDLDMDGDMELVVAGYDSRIHVWDLKAPYSTEAVPWGMYHHDIWHTGMAGFEAPGDTLPPSHTIGVFQGTVVDRVLDIYVAPSEFTESAPIVRIGTASGREALAVEAVPSTARTFRAHHMTEAASAETVLVSSTDLSGNAATEERVITYSRLVDGELVALSFDGTLEVRSGLAPGAPVVGILPFDRAYLAVGDDMVAERLYNVCTFGAGGETLRLSMLAGSDEAVYMYDGGWVQAAGQFREGGSLVLPEAGPGIYGLGKRLEPVDGALRISLAGPNPFSGECRISLAGAPASRVRVRVFDVRGRLVAGIYEGELGESGDIVWTGRDGGGRKVSSGIYFINAESSSASVSRKLIYVR